MFIHVLSCMNTVRYIDYIEFKSASPTMEFLKCLHQTSHPLAQPAHSALTSAMASARRKPPLTGATVRRSNRRDRRVTLRSFCPSNLLTQCDRALRSKTTGTGAPQRSCSPVIPQNLRRFRTGTQQDIDRSHKVRTKISVTIARSR